MCAANGGQTGEASEPNRRTYRPRQDTDAEFSALLEDSVEDLYDNAPCGYLSTLMDGQIAKVNNTLLTWLGYQHADVVGRLRFADLLTIGGKLYHETHYAPLLRMQGEVREIALELVALDGRRLPVLVSSTVKTNPDGQPLLVRTTVFDARDRRAYEKELLRARKESDRERERLQRLATTLQRSLLPPALPAVPGLEIAAYYHAASAEEVGGDFYDLFPLGTDRWGFFVGDVCGKGPQAAALTSLIRYTLRAAAVYDTDPLAVLSNLNTVLLQQRSPGAPRFCTVVFGLLVPDHHGFRLTVAGGGHPPALAIRADGAVQALDTPSGQLVGVLTEPHFAATTSQLNPGDGLLLYTDGLSEARTANGGMLGEEHLIQLVTNLAGADANAIVQSLKTLLIDLGQRLSDDTAILAFTVPDEDRVTAPAEPTN
jgi:sigma-B regulation protein RsbU (phosphoserine phosphatase)